MSSSVNIRSARNGGLGGGSRKFPPPLDSDSKSFKVKPVLEKSEYSPLYKDVNGKVNILHLEL